MDERTRAEEHLRAIRSLMERATIYRAITAPSALAGGVGASVLGLGGHFHVLPIRSHFLWWWLGLLVITASTNIASLYWSARRRAEPFVSPGMRWALASLFPSFLVAGWLTLASSPNNSIIGFYWAVLYGLALLSTQHFAPRSIQRLGWMFLISGMVGPILEPSESCSGTHVHLFMAITFGGFHLLYAACTWPRKGAEPTITPLE